MNNLEPDSVPRIVWGKYFKSENKVIMPLSVQAHHALVDGRQIGVYFEKLEKEIKTFNAELK